ncbi:MAG: asparagine ligase [Candidatus Aenigmatarchaeota archaeon]|nr:MAG: asparagine ligase [Candidatus Aenigmarchaeota archaeon]
MCGILGRKEMKALVKIQSEIVREIRRFLFKKGFLEVLPPLFDEVTDPGIRRAKFFEIEFYGKSYKLMSALTVHKQILASHFGKIFSFCPCFRKEDKKARYTKRHLAQFWQVEVEIPYASYEDAMKLVERLVQSVCKHVKEKCRKELKVLKSDLKVPSLPFPRIKHEDAVRIARKLGRKAYWEKELPWEAEKALSLHFKQPFFIFLYPAGSRGFYEKIESRKSLSFDLIYDSGFGEGCSGSERECEYEKILKKIKGTHLEKSKWYLDSIKKLKPSSGFGIGLERLTRYICKLPSIEKATLFPRIPGG